MSEPAPREADPPPRGADAPPDEATQQPSGRDTTRPRRRWRRRLLVSLGGTPLLIAALWLAVHHVPGFGPLVADSLRAVFGASFVAWLEDTAYGLEDWFNRRIRGDRAPEPLWEVPSAATRTDNQPHAAASGAASAQPTLPTFRLASIGRMHDNMMTRGDGIWVPLGDPRHPDDRVRMLKTFLHPDGKRSWAVMAVVAVDLRAVELHLVAGRHEPRSATAEAKRYHRAATVPEADRDALIAAFNGGYKATHGDYGMRVDGVTLVPARPLSCTVAHYRDGHLLVRPWAVVKDSQSQMSWFRQTPICMVDRGKPHPGLAMPKLGWGASVVSGTTVIRRSAIGIDRAGRVLYVSIGDFLTAKSIAEGMHHAGADSVAQLDVNFSFPKFFTYREDADGSLSAVPLTNKFEYQAHEYVGDRAARDFFYLTRRGAKRAHE